MKFTIPSLWITPVLTLAASVGEKSSAEPTIRMDCIMIAVERSGKVRVGGVGRDFSFVRTVTQLKNPPAERVQFFIKNEYVDAIKALKPSTRKKDPTLLEFDFEGDTLTVFNLDTGAQVKIPLETDSVQEPLLQAYTAAAFSRKGTQHWVTLPTAEPVWRGLLWASYLNTDTAKKERDHQAKIVRLSVAPLSDDQQALTGYLSAFGLQITATNRRRFVETYVPLTRRSLDPQAPVDVPVREMSKFEQQYRPVIPVGVMEQADDVAYEPIVVMYVDLADKLAKLLQPEESLRLYINFIESGAKDGEKPLTMILKNGPTLVRVTVRSDAEHHWNLANVQEYLYNRKFENLVLLGTLANDKATCEKVKLALALGSEFGARLVCEGPDQPLVLESKSGGAAVTLGTGQAACDVVVDAILLDKLLTSLGSTELSLYLTDGYLVIREPGTCRHQVLATLFKG